MSVRGKRVDWLVYFSLNNIELEILLNSLEVLVKEIRASTLRDLAKPVVFKSINPSLVEKLVSRGILKKFFKRGKNLYSLTSRGLKAFFVTARPVLSVLRVDEGYSVDEVAEMIKTRVFYGGIHRVHQVHVRLVGRFLDLLSEIGLVRRNDGLYYAVPKDEALDALASFISKASAVTPIRRVEDLVESIVSILGYSPSDAETITMKISTMGINIGEQDPERALFDLMMKARKHAVESIKAGKVLESLAYEALGLETLRTLERLNTDARQLHNYRINFQFYFYETLGDYFYQNLNFEAAKLCYHWAVSVARDSPDMARDAHRANAKFLLSLARSLAQKGRYEDAIARLDELIGYYRSTGLMREAEIAEALRREYMAEIEVRRNKPCNAYKSWISAASKYDELGGEYKSKAQALRVKALISKAECLLISEKNVADAVAILEEASKKAEEILSPHLRNVAKSILHEARASMYVSEGRLLEASREYAEASKYYELRGFIYRSLLNMARSHKFRGFHYVLGGDVSTARECFGNALREYRVLIEKLARQYSRTRSIDYYMVKEGIKGYYDSRALLSLVEAYELVHSSPILNEYIIKTLIDKINESLESWVEAGREREYEILSRVRECTVKLSNNTGIHDLIRVLGEIAELNDDISEGIDANDSPRFKTMVRLVQDLLSAIKGSLEVITRYIEELSNS